MLVAKVTHQQRQHQRLQQQHAQFSLNNNSVTQSLYTAVSWCV